MGTLPTAQGATEYALTIGDSYFGLLLAYSCKVLISDNITEEITKQLLYPLRTSTSYTVRYRLPHHHKANTTLAIKKALLKAFPPRAGTRQECLLSQLLFNIVLRVPASTGRQDKEINASKW